MRVSLAARRGDSPPISRPCAQSHRQPLVDCSRDQGCGHGDGAFDAPVANAYEAAGEIERTTGVDIRLVNLPWLNRIDRSWLRETIGDRRLVITLDNHYVHGGQGQMLAASVAELGLEPTPRVVRIGVTELPECGTNEEVLAHHGLDVAGLVKRLTHVLPQVV